MNEHVAPHTSEALLHAAIRLQEHLQAFVSYQNLVASTPSSTATDPAQEAHLRQLATTLQQSCLRFLRDHVAHYQAPSASMHVAFTPDEEAALLQELENFRHELRPMRHLPTAAYLEDSPLLCAP